MHQYVQFYVDDEISAPGAMPPRLNRLLSPDVRVLQLQRVPASFSVRLHATWREYWYLLAWGDVCDPIKRRHTAFTYGDLDVPAMRSALECMVGTHDFEAFSNINSDAGSTMRTVVKAQMVMLGPKEARIEVCSSFSPAAL